jgi:hypothetical protein
VQDKDQLKLTDENSRIMKVAGRGVEHCYNAPATVATGSMLIVATEVTLAANDKGQPKSSVEPSGLADTRYLSQGNVEQYSAAKVEPRIAMGRSPHHVSWKQCFAAAPKFPPESATSLQKMTHRLKTPRAGNFTRRANKRLSRCLSSSNR